jgi:hypothetical protein
MYATGGDRPNLAAEATLRLVRRAAFHPLPERSRMYALAATVRVLSALKTPFPDLNMQY